MSKVRIKLSTIGRRGWKFTLLMRRRRKALLLEGNGEGKIGRCVETGGKDFDGVWGEGDRSCLAFTVERKPNTSRLTLGISGGWVSGVR